MQETGQTASVLQLGSKKASPGLKTFKAARAEAHAKALLRAIQRAHKKGKHKEADRLTIVYLNSLDAKYVAVKNASKSAKNHRRTRPDRFLAIAKSLNPWEGTQETVIFRPQDKDGDPWGWGYRITMDFGPENRSLQHLVRSVLEARSNLHPNQFLMHGGVPAAIRRVAELLGKGYEWAAETDISLCYPSFKGEKVAELLPVPAQVARMVLISASFCLSLGNIFGPADPDFSVEETWSELFAEARRGLPQGSAASPIVVEMLLASLFDKLPDCGESVGYVDNFLMMAKDESDVVSMTKALWSALKAHPVGPFGPNKPKLFRPGQPIDFLGHTLRLCNGSVRIDPSKENLAKFKHELNRGLQRIGALSSQPMLMENRAHDLIHYVKSWTAAFKLCANMAEYRAEALEDIAKAASGKLIVA